MTTVTPTMVRYRHTQWSNIDKESVLVRTTVMYITTTIVKS